MRKVRKASKSMIARAQKILARGRRIRRAKLLAARDGENGAKKRRVLIHGPEPWRTVQRVTFTHWDRWFLRLAVEDDDNWVTLEKTLQERRYSVTHSTSDAEAKLSHMADLCNRLAKVRKTPRAVLRQEVDDRALLYKAKTKIFDQYLDRKYATAAMQNTPRRRLKKQALRGHWSRFPASPSLFEESIFDPESARPFYGENATMRLADRIERRVERLIRRADDVAEQLAIYRAAMTAILVAVERANDSCGCLGETFSLVLDGYRAVPWKDTGIDAEVFFADLIEFATWEDYGLIDALQGFFKAISPEERDIVFRLLDRIEAELQGHGFKFQAEELDDIRVTVLIEQRQWDLMEDRARAIGSSRWRPIMKMAAAALKKRKVPLAKAIFQAADQPGSHQEYLREQAKLLLRKRKRR